MRVVCGRRGVVVARYARYPPLAQKRRHLVRPGRVAHQVAEVVGSVHVGAGVHASEHRLQGGEVAVDIGYQGVLHATSGRDAELISTLVYKGSAAAELQDG